MLRYVTYVLFFLCTFSALLSWPPISSGRPLTGFLRSGTGARPTSGQAMDLTTAMAGTRPATSRPLTSMGR